MNFIRKHKKISITILIILSIYLITSITFGRYIYNIFNNHILETKGFYFNSSVLSINNKDYNINNWDGVNSYTLTIDVNNKKNEVKSTNSDITYVTSVKCSDNVICNLSKETGTIYEDKKTDSYQITIVPTTNFYENDEVIVSTTATSTYPYTKTLSATYVIGVEKSKFSYNIEDSENSKYLTLNLINSISYYQVEKAFSSYKVGDQISAEKYNSLSAAEKNNCYSAKVTLTINPNIINLDMTSSTYLNKIENSENTVKVDGKDYISSYTFKMNANSSQKVLFYKENIKENYTYPITNDKSIINVSVTTAE